jgi:hypothetical protein
MSIEALRWAMRQKSRNSSTQCVLLVLANAADPEGVAFAWWKSRDHWWPYLVDKTRLSRGALFRILKELEEFGYFSRGEAKPNEGGRAQPVIQLHIDRDIAEPLPASESITATEEPERDGQNQVSQSIRETENESPPATETPAPVTPRRLVQSPSWNTEDVPLGNHITPQSPPLHRGSAGEEANGFAAFWSEYPDHQAMNRSSALRAFCDLTQTEQQQAIRTVGFYARDITKLKRRPVSPANWLRERRFSEYGAGRQTSAASGSQQLVAEGSEPWKAWINVAAVTFGGSQKVPHFWASNTHRGIWRPSLWPLGGEAWLVPLEKWIFIESGTAQHGRWCERINEMIGRAPIPVISTRVKAARSITAKLDTGSREMTGLLVPLEWPPPKGSSGAGPPKSIAHGTGLTEEEAEEFARTG